jgi:hypothetical protein
MTKSSWNVRNLSDYQAYDNPDPQKDFPRILVRKSGKDEDMYRTENSVV